ncbi:hypothetical protein DIPPA_07012 [Diplonema papillatum]|nr:hypothetical protein DIPPA_07012 [Diplonema papillatum]
MSNEYTTYDDDSCMGQAAPSTELADFVAYPSQDQYRLDLHPGKVNVVYFMCKFEKGAYICNEEMSYLCDELKDTVQVVALSTDPDRGTVEKFLEKSRKGEVTDLNTGKPYRLTMDVAWDEGKRTFGMYRSLCINTKLRFPPPFRSSQQKTKQKKRTLYHVERIHDVR